MASTPSEIALALTGGVTAALVGEFRYDASRDRWWWADDVYRMYGLDPGAVVPTTAMVLSHAHPDDAERYAAVLRDAGANGGSFASIHRIVDAGGDTRILATVADAEAADDAAVVTGYVVDVTGSVGALAAAEASRQVRQSGERRAVIDQAVGIVAARTGARPDEAFALLRTVSMHDNVKLRDLALQIVAQATSGAEALTARPGTVDEILAAPAPGGPGQS